MSRFSVVYDANILYPNVLRDILIRLAKTGVFRARWTEDILDEVFRNIKADRPDLDTAKLDRTRELMCAAVDDCLVDGYQELIEGLVLPDADDRHVLAAAIRAGAQVIVTNNTKDFPASEGSRVRPLEVRARATVPDMNMQRVKKFAIAVAVPGALVLGVSGCSQSTGGQPVAEGTAAATSAAQSAATSAAARAGQCAPASGRVLTLPAKAAGEPTLGLPQPAGWDRETSQDSAVIRGAIVNKKLVADGFAANAVITLENAKGMTPQQALDAQVQSLRDGLKVTDLRRVPGTVCGYPSTTVTYAMPGSTPNHKVTTVAVSVPDGANLWSVTLTVQSKMPDDATYRRDSQAILAGLQITK